MITGASSGIGYFLAKEFASKGAQLSIVARRLDRLQALASELSKDGTPVETCQADVTASEDLNKAVEKTLKRFEKIDVVIANAGFGVAGDFERLKLEDYQRQFETNIYGVLRTIYSTLDSLKKSRGTLVLIGSVAGHIALPGSSAYSMSKSAIKALAEALRHELKPHGVSVVLISPGFIESEFRMIDNKGVFHKGYSDPVPAWLRMPTETAARQIVAAIAKRKAETVITIHGKFGVFMKRYFPFLVELVLGRAHAREEPQN